MTHIECLEAVPPKPWGIIATFLWAVLALFFSGIASILPLVLRTGGGELGQQELMNDGLVVSLMVLILAAVQVPVLIWRRGAAAGGPYLHSRIRSALSPDILLAMA